MQRLNGREVVMQLITAYEEEAALYAGLEEAAADQRHLLANGQDPGRLAALDAGRAPWYHTPSLAEHIGKIEAGIAPLREYWEKVRDGARDSRVRALARTLDQLLEELVERIHTIVEIEKENSQALLAVRTANGT